ncbi:recombinase family protein [Flavonifractor plautii]|nr:recombinase family protein [Flavonifractor plautii]
MNQKRYLESYAAQRGYTNIVHYTDDGWSGGNFDRPAWKRLVADIEAGKVAHLLCKDLSRIGRNYLQTGFYTEVMFRQNGVHFVAVANNIDSEEQDSGEFAPFLNIMNEWYLRDQSKRFRQHTVSRARRVSPPPTTPSMATKRPGGQGSLAGRRGSRRCGAADLPACGGGHGPHEIAKILTQEKVECPAYYLARNGRGSRKNTVDTSRPYDWYGFTVSSMLTKPEYMGHTVNFRSSKKSYRDKRVKMTRPTG